MTNPSIMIVEDHAVFGHALLSLLGAQKAEMDVVGVFHSGEEAIEKLPGLDVDLALIDVSLPNMTGLQLLSELQEKYPNILCVMLSGHMTPAYVKRAFEAGARGYILKDDVVGLIAGIQKILQGEIYVSEALRNRYL